MFEKLKRKPKVIIHQYEFVPPFNFEGATREEIIVYFKSLSRVQLMHFGDTTDIDEIETELDLWALYYEVLNWHGSWPQDEETTKALNVLYWNKDSLWQKYKDMRDTLSPQIEGIQKKIDKIEKLIENAEFKLCGKEAMKL